MCLGTSCTSWLWIPALPVYWTGSFMLDLCANPGVVPSLQCFSSTADAQTQLACLSTLRTDILQFLYLHTSSAFSPVYRLWSTCHSELYEPRRAEQAERWQVRFGVKESKEIHLKKNSLPVPTGCEVWKRQIQLRREILGWSLTALKLQLSNFPSERRKTTCLVSSVKVTRQKGTFYHHMRSPYPERCVWLGLCISRRT